MPFPPPGSRRAPIAEAVGFGAACEYLSDIGMNRVYEHEKLLGRYLYERLAAVPGVRIYGPAPTQGDRTGLVAFNIEGLHATDLAFFLDQEGVAVRAGHHCAQPLHAILGAKGSARASLYFYNDREDVDVFVQAVEETIRMFASLSNN